jgi:hypothetical protein
VNQSARRGLFEFVRVRTIAFLLAAFALGSPSITRADDAADTREKQFTYLLRTYPERPPDVTLGQVAQLVDQGPFAERDRAIFWIGSARLSLADHAAARVWFAKLSREHPDSVWVQRSYLGLAEAAAFEHHFDEALSWYSRADQSSDATVRELARISRPQVMTLQRRQKIGWLCGALVAAAMLLLLVSTLRAARLASNAPPNAKSDAKPESFAQLIRRALAPPAEARILLPLLLVVAIASLGQDSAPRGAALELCIAGGVLVWLSGAFLRAHPLALPKRAAYALGLLVILGCGAYVAIWRHDLVGMVQETWRAGPD